MKNKSKTRILVDDDDDVSRKVVCQMLMGYETVAASSELEALGCVTRNSGLDFVLTDINMPHIDGWQPADRIKAIDPGMPIVVLTGEKTDRILSRL